MKKQRVLVFVMAVSLLFLVTFAAFYIGSEINHDCIGDNCPICCQVNMCESTVKSISSGIGTIAPAVATLVFLILDVSADPEVRLFDTLVSLKVKLSD